MAFNRLPYRAPTRHLITVPKG